METTARLNNVLIFFSLTLIFSQAGCIPGDGVQGNPLRYIDNGDGTITDLNTMLMWEKKVGVEGDRGCVFDPHYVNSSCTFQQATGPWIDELNVEGGTGYAGYNDWRLPHVKELLSIVDFSRCSAGDERPDCADPAAIHPIFGPTDGSPDGLYWSFTNVQTQDEDPKAYSVLFYAGKREANTNQVSPPKLKTAAAPVRAVRDVLRAVGGRSFPGDGVRGNPLRYLDNGDGTVTDLNTMLMWERKVEGVGGAITCLSSSHLHIVNSRCAFEETASWIKMLNGEGDTGYAGYKDWRLPHIKELQSIADYSRCGSPPDAPLPDCVDAAAIDPDLGPTRLSFYWSSTLDPYDPNKQVFGVGFIGGGVTMLAKVDDDGINSRPVRAVRDVRVNRVRLFPRVTSGSLGAPAERSTSRKNFEEHDP